MDGLFGIIGTGFLSRFNQAALVWPPDGVHLDPELDVLGFYVPFALLVLAGGFLMAWMLAWAMDRLGLTRFVWHPPLFLFAMMIGCSAGLGLLVFPR